MTSPGKALPHAAVHGDVLDRATALAVLLADPGDAMAIYPLMAVLQERVLACTAGDKAIDQPAAQIRLATALANVVRIARAVIADVCAGAGASIYYQTSPLQRQRDIEVLKGHVVFDWDRTAELAGRVALALPLRPTDLL